MLSTYEVCKVYICYDAHCPTFLSLIILVTNASSIMEQKTCGSPQIFIWIKKTLENVILAESLWPSKVQGFFTVQGLFRFFHCLRFILKLKVQGSLKFQSRSRKNCEKTLWKPWTVKKPCKTLNREETMKKPCTLLGYKLSAILIYNNDQNNNYFAIHSGSCWQFKTINLINLRKYLYISTCIKNWST